mmetsp:Transcript_18138/g.51771  ORF Transcript_18138/g.51771 Transcript_18138/m.51771 type:complete len:202 (+) Transcript_18138:251-856(+)
MLGGSGAGAASTGGGAVLSAAGGASSWGFLLSSSAPMAANFSAKYVKGFVGLTRMTSRMHSARRSSTENSARYLTAASVRALAFELRGGLMTASPPALHATLMARLSVVMPGMSTGTSTACASSSRPKLKARPPTRRKTSTRPKERRSTPGSGNLYGFLATRRDCFCVSPMRRDTKVSSGTGLSPAGSSTTSMALRGGCGA